MKPAVVLIIGSFLGCCRAQGVAWGYDNAAGNGPLNWGNLPGYATCSTGRMQSPINIQRSSAIYGSYPPLSLITYPEATSFEFENGGTAPDASPLPAASRIRLSGGPLGSETYQLFNFHMHYGNYTFASSEHAFDGTRTSGELHSVFYNARYATIQAALQSGDRNALAVIAMLFSASSAATPHPGLTQVFRFFSNLTYRGDDVEEDFDYSTLVRSEDITEYYTYNGSLTTPACNEQVIWLVLNQVQYITPETLASISGLLNGNRTDANPTPTLGNSRPLQPIYNRTVIRNFGVPSTTAAPPVSTDFNSNVCPQLALATNDEERYRANLYCWNARFSEWNTAYQNWLANGGQGCAAPADPSA